MFVAKCFSNHHVVRPLFVGIMFFIRNFQKLVCRWVGHYHYPLYTLVLFKSSICQIMTKIIMAIIFSKNIINMGTNESFLNLKLSQDINNGENVVD